MKDVTLIKIVAIISLTVLETIALYKGIDSNLMITISAIIGGIAGYTIGVKRSGK